MVNKNFKIAIKNFFEILKSIENVDYVPKKNLKTYLGIIIDNIQLLKNIIDVFLT